MTNDRSSSAIEMAASRLRQIVLSTPEGELIGSEESLLASFSVSRATMRQVARLLEREGLLKVRRGINGGYFSARPDTQLIVNVVTSYLDMLGLDKEDALALSSTLWVQVIRKAASVLSEEAALLAKNFARRVRALPANAPLMDVLKLEQQSREAIFALIDARYVELIFRINSEFGQRKTADPTHLDSTPEHAAFVHEWKRAKLLELAAISDGDPELGALAAAHMRNVLSKRIKFGWSAVSAPDA